jgi:CubicO group peptidase (beta-lactamase class C family)
MTSGFGSYLSEFANSGKAYKKVCKKLRKNQFNYKVNGDITSYILSKGTPHDYGEYHYSNSGYFLLGKIIGSFSDGGYQGYITDNIITPLKLKNTNFVYAKSDTTGYNESTENWISSANSLYLNNFYILFSSMGIESTAEDLNTLIDAILNNEIADGVDCLSKIKSGDTKFNYGFYVNGNILSTQGTSDVHSSYIYIDTDRMIKSIVLSNHIGIDNFDQYGKTVYNAVNAKLNGMLIDNA